MSFFYLSPVKGDIPLHIMETIINKRIECLNHFSKENKLSYNEYVIDGSLYDNVGHFMLCILAILGENYGFAQFFLKTESDLFKWRLETLTTYDMRCFARKLLKTLKKYDNVHNSISNPLQILCYHLTLKTLAQHVCAATHGPDCIKHNIEINFKYCLPFVAKRQVELKNGIAYIPCGKWIQYLSHLFYINLKQRLHKTDLNKLRNDPRTMELVHKFKSDTFSQNNSSTNKLFCKEVDNVSKWFPPCMLALHRSLRDRHRLSHSQRFYYTLFLKDIGMPVEEAIEFWRAEYRQIPNHHSCCHTWEKDEKKFLYGIRHMYGLEGGRKNYTSVSCQRIQSDTSCSEGGCPFKAFDEPKMIKLLSHNNELLSQIQVHKQKNDYTSACLTYLKNVTKTNCDVSFNFSPVKYYSISYNIS